MRVEAGKEYRSRRGERVLVTEVEPSGDWPVHFIVLDGPYKGGGKRDGSRLTIEGRSMAPKDRVFRDHLNDLVAEWSDDRTQGETRNVAYLPPAQKCEPMRRAG